MSRKNIMELEMGKFDEQSNVSKASIRTKVMNSLINTEYDEIGLTYVSSGNGEGEVETVIYKNNGITVATLTLSYDENNNLSGVVKS